MMKPASLPLTLALAACLAGCGTTRFSDSSRTATEMLLISDAVDQSVSVFDFNSLSGKKVFFDPQHLEMATDKGYVISSIRQHLLAHGCLLMEDRKDAQYVVEARCGGIGTDRHDLLFGIPQIQIPAVIPGYPTSIPEIPFAKRSEQKGVAKLAVFAYNRQTGRPVWQSGVVKKDSTNNDLWLLGCGPFRKGNLTRTTEFAGQTIVVPFLAEGESGEHVASTSSVPVTQPAIWQEPSAQQTHVLIGFPVDARVVEPKKAEEKKDKK